jgi:hypothetical protein
MNSGLEWEEYSTICATTMLFQSGNMGRIQLEKIAALNLTLIGTIPLGRLTYCPIF